MPKPLHNEPPIHCAQTDFAYSRCACPEQLPQLYVTPSANQNVASGDPSDLDPDCLQILTPEYLVFNTLGTKEACY